MSALLLTIGWLLPTASAWLLIGRLAPALHAATRAAAAVSFALAFAALLARITHPYAFGWQWLAAIGLLAIAIGIGWRNARAVRIPWGWIALLLALVLLRSSFSLLDLFHQPVLAWDAYNVWALRAKTWFLSGQWTAFARELEYVTLAPGTKHFSPAAHYPETPSLLMLYAARAAGVWEDGVAMSAWALFLPALALSVFGAVAAANVKPWIGVALGYVLIALPLPQAHVAHAGYVDLWLLLAVLVALNLWQAHDRMRTPGTLTLALLASALLPLIKLDGWLWLACVLGARTILYAPAKLLLGAWLALIVGITLLVMGYGFSAQLGPFGAMELSREGIQLPGMTRYTLHFSNSAPALLETLLWQPTWGPLFWLLPLLSLLALKRWLGDAQAKLLLCFWVLGAIAFALLFFFTSAAEFAENATASNRLLLPLIGSGLVLLGLAFRPPSTPTPSVSA
jgi:hypothetical protein